MLPDFCKTEITKVNFDGQVYTAENVLVTFGNHEITLKLDPALPMKTASLIVTE